MNRTYHIMNARIIFNYVLVRLGIRKILPAEIINRMKVRECGDEMVILDDEYMFFPEGQTMYARKKMAEKLINAVEAVNLKGLKFIVYETYRSPEKQAQRRKRNLQRIIKEHPEYDEAQRTQALNRASAKVGSSGHQTGGAIDLTLCKMDGTPLDMGTEYLEHNSKTVTDSNEITLEQRRNRDILFSVMQEAGFINYPGEWWHFSYGDKMWAAYKHKSYAIYDDVSYMLESHIN